MAVSEIAPVTVPALRLRRPGWRDPRLLIGLVLLFGSLAIGARVVATAGHTRPVFAARTALPAGTPLRADELEVVRVRVDNVRAGYLDATGLLPAGAVLTRTVGAGELVPVAAIGSAADLTVRPVTIPLDAVPGGLSVGGRVDLWSAARQADRSGNGYEAPVEIAASIEVFAVSAPGTGLNSERTASVQVLLPAGSLPAVLDALANEARLSILPVLGLTGAPGPAS